MLKTKEARRRDIQRALLQKKKLKEKEEADKEKQNNTYPTFINSLNKSAQRVDANVGITKLDPFNAAFISYFKLRQVGLEEIRIVTVATYAWTEFKYDDEWWIFDPLTLKNIKLGDPLKRKKFIKEEPYTNFSRTFSDMDKFLSIYDYKIEYTKDEAKIAAMKDTVLFKIFKK